MGDDEVPPGLQLPYYVGLVCIADVDLEVSLTSVQTTLRVGAGQVPTRHTDAMEWMLPQLLGRRIEACFHLVERLDRVNDDERDALRGLLSACSAAHEVRNRLVHDRWFAAFEKGEQPQWMREQVSMSGVHQVIVTVDELRQAWLNLISCRIRVTGAVFALNAAVLGLGTADPTNWETARGEFDVLPGPFVAYQLHSQRKASPSESS
jgi:hypothetical protein